MTINKEYWDHHWPFSVYLDRVRKCEQNMQNECVCSIGTSKDRAEYFIGMFNDIGYNANLQSLHDADSDKTFYSVVVKCKYKYNYDHITHDLYALMDTRTGNIVQFNRSGHKELAVFNTPSEAKGECGLNSTDISALGKEYIRIITLKMDADITE